MKRLLLLAAILLGSCSPRVLTACADPNNMPFSNQAGQGQRGDGGRYWYRTSGLFRVRDALSH